jgi:hypothetical protein
LVLHPFRKTSASGGLLSPRSKMSTTVVGRTVSSDWAVGEPPESR